MECYLSSQSRKNGRLPRRRQVFDCNLCKLKAPWSILVAGTQYLFAHCSIFLLLNLSNMQLDIRSHVMSSSLLPAAMPVGRSQYR